MLTWSFFDNPPPKRVLFRGRETVEMWWEIPIRISMIQWLEPLVDNIGSENRLVFTMIFKIFSWSVFPPSIGIQHSDTMTLSKPLERQKRWKKNQRHSFLHTGMQPNFILVQRKHPLSNQNISSSSQKCHDLVIYIYSHHRTPFVCERTQYCWFFCQRISLGLCFSQLSHFFMQKWIQAALLVYRHLIIYVWSNSNLYNYFSNKEARESNLAGSRLHQDVNGCFVRDRSEGPSARKWNGVQIKTHMCSVDRYIFL